MARSIQAVNVDGSGHAEDIAESRGVPQLLLERCEMRIVFAGMGFICVKEDRAGVPILVLAGKGSSWMAPPSRSTVR